MDMTIVFKNIAIVILGIVVGLIVNMGLIIFGGIKFTDTKFFKNIS